MAIRSNAASFFFPKGTRYEHLWEARLRDASGKSAGNVDHVLVTVDAAGRVTDFGSLEVQSVYISGTIRSAFEHFMTTRNRLYDWSSHTDYPRPDYLSSSRKRLGPQIAYKGAILKQWRKRQAIALQRSFYNTLQPLTSVDKSRADIVWLVYDLVHDATRDTYNLALVDTVYTTLEDTLRDINTPQPGDVNDFLTVLQRKFEEKRAGRIRAVSDEETIMLPLCGKQSSSPRTKLVLVHRPTVHGRKRGQTCWHTLVQPYRPRPRGVVPPRC